MMVWLRPQYILAFVTSLYYCSQLVCCKSYEKFWCATEEGLHQLSCPDESALLTDISIRKVYRRNQMCEPDDHTDYLIHCQAFLNDSLCEGNKTCSIAISSRDYIQCGEKTYPPTYFFVKYTCMQIHTMCTDTLPIRNTLYGYIVSPAYPHPMADNLKCSLSIEADPSMYIELTPIQVHLQEALKCRSEYLEILGYDSSYEMNNVERTNIWKGYHIWCGTDRSLNNPIPNAHYLISSNSLYMSLQTTISKKPRYFKIRYKIVPSTARSHYNSDGIAFGSIAKGQVVSTTGLITSTSVISTTIIVPLLNHNDIRNLNVTIIKKPLKKEIFIGIIAGVVALLIAIVAGILIFILIKRRRSSTNTRKKPASSTPSNITSKSTTKSSDKAPLLEQTTNPSSATATKRKLVPERTVQISDASSSRFKSNAPTGSKPGPTKPENSTSRPTLSAADSGIYGADLTEELPTLPKPTSSTVSDPPKIPPIDLPSISEATPTVVVHQSNETPPTISPVVLSNNIDTHSPSITENKIESLFDHTIQSAYSNLIDATTSENEGTICGSELQSRRTSHSKSSPMSSESNNIEAILISDKTDSSAQNIISFNPLHVILKKDANKYYTTEYI